MKKNYKPKRYQYEMATWSDYKFAHPTVEAAHVPVGHAVSVDNLLFDHLLASLGCFLFVNPVGLEPVIMRDLAVDGLRSNNLRSPPEQPSVKIPLLTACVKV